MRRRQFLALPLLGLAGLMVVNRPRTRPTISTNGEFQYYSVVDHDPEISTSQFQLTIDGLVSQPRNYSWEDLQALPQSRIVRDFHCVTGWVVRDVPWGGVKLSTVMSEVEPQAKALRLYSSDQVYTESLTLDQAVADDVFIATSMFDQPITPRHGGPVRLYTASMLGYKSIKWLNRIELVNEVIPGYWEERGYGVDPWIGKSDGWGKPI